MQVGVCTWTFGPLPIEEIARRVRRLGFDGVELHGDIEAFQPDQIRDLVAEHELQIFSLTPKSVDIVHENRATRGRAVAYYRRLIDFAVELGDGVRVSCHSRVGKVKAFGSQVHEEMLLREVMTEICEYAYQRNVPVVFEVLNRYESNLVNTCVDAVALAEHTGEGRLNVLLDCYHMNIEEEDLAAAIRHAGSRLGLFHVADSNRRGIGKGHTEFLSVFAALKEIGYSGPVIFEMSPPGPNPFTPVKEGDYLTALEEELGSSISWIQRNTVAE